MKRIEYYLTLAAGLLLALPIHAQELRPDYKSISPGLDYANVRTTNWNNGEPWSIHIARMDRTQKDLRLVSGLAHNQVFRTAPVSAIAKGIPESVGRALAAINTGFCINVKNPYYGMPRGLVITEGQLISAPFKYSLWVNENGGMQFGKVEPKFNVTLPDGKTFPIGLNRECKPDEVVLFTHVLGKSTRATNNLELVLEDGGKDLFWRASKKYSLRVKAVNPTGDSELSNTVAVLSFGTNVAAQLGKLVPGDKFKIDLAMTHDLSKATTGCQTIFPIVQDGEIVKEFDTGSYLKLKHPRTAIGFNSRYFFMVVVDGRKKDLSMGMLPEELGKLMVLLGCIDAMNLDGGGSTTFWSDGQVRNSVAGSRERDRSDALVIVKRPAPTAAALGGGQ